MDADLKAGNLDGVRGCDRMPLASRQAARVEPGPIAAQVGDEDFVPFRVQPEMLAGDAGSVQRKRAFGAPPERHAGVELVLRAVERAAIQGARRDQEFHVTSRSARDSRAVSRASWGPSPGTRRDRASACRKGRL